ncbi:MAG: hypothetical protein H0T73_00060 [Ardenticatenales bacterium]|nr:hypothetical protein [Ardenticatenales bacterium]
MADARQELVTIEQMLALHEQLCGLGAPAPLLSTLQGLLGARREVLHAQGVQVDAGAGPLAPDLSTIPEEQLLAALSQHHAEALATLQHQHEQNLATLHERHRQEQMVAQLQQLLDEGKWDEFLDLAPYIPAALLAERDQWRFQIEDLDERFRDAIESFQLPVAQKSLMVLAALDKNLKAFDERKREYEALERHLANELIDHRYEQRVAQPRHLSRPRAPGDDLVSVLEHLHRLLLEANYPALAEQVVAFQQAITQPAAAATKPARGVTSSARRLPVGLGRPLARTISHARQLTARRVPASVLRARHLAEPPVFEAMPRPYRRPPAELSRGAHVRTAQQPWRGTHGRRPTAATLAARHHRIAQVSVEAQAAHVAEIAEATALLQAGLTALERLTPDASRQAHRHLEQAAQFPESIRQGNLSSQLEAAQTLLRLLTEPLEPTTLAALDPIPEFQDLLRLASDHEEARRWVASTSVMGWMDQARRIFPQARTLLSQGERAKGADLLSVSYALSQMVRHVAQEQWRALLPEQHPHFTTLAAFQAEVRKVGQMLRK